MVLSSTDTFYPRWHSVQSLNRVNVSRSQYINVVILTKEGFALCPCICRSKNIKHNICIICKDVFLCNDSVFMYHITIAQHAHVLYCMQQLFKNCKLHLLYIHIRVISTLFCCILINFKSALKTKQ